MLSPVMFWLRRSLMSYRPSGKSRDLNQGAFHHSPLGRYAAQDCRMVAGNDSVGDQTFEHGFDQIVGITPARPLFERDRHFDRTRRQPGPLAQDLRTRGLAPFAVAFGGETAAAGRILEESA